MNAACLVDCRNTLGEGCVWDPRNETLYWTDIEERLIYSLQLIIPTESCVPYRCRSARPSSCPGRRLDLSSGSRVELRSAMPHSTSSFPSPRSNRISLELRVNDATVDPTGGVVFGTVDEKARLPVAALYRLSRPAHLLVCSAALPLPTDSRSRQMGNCCTSRTRPMVSSVDSE